MLRNFIILVDERPGSFSVALRINMFGLLGISSIYFFIFYWFLR